MRAVMTTLLRRGLLLLLALAGGAIISPSAHALVVCTDSAPSIAFGAVNVSTSIGASGTGSIGYQCTNISATAATFSLCAGIGMPSSPGTACQPELLNGNNNTLNFNLYTNAPQGQAWTTATPISVPVSIPAGIGTTATGTISFFGFIPGGQTSPAGSYNAEFSDSMLGFLSGTQCVEIQNGDIGDAFTLPVTATQTNNCIVGASPTLNLGSVNAGTTNVTGSNTILVTCPSKTAYFIGLSPSNGNLNGAGVMSSTGTNTDQVPYQLHSVSASGPIWGNTATATSLGNGVAGTGTGTQQSVTVFASVPSSDFTPGTYSDTVTIFLNF
jgi:spore coat protein U-like protein